MKSDKPKKVKAPAKSARSAAAKAPKAAATKSRTVAAAKPAKSGATLARPEKRPGTRTKLEIPPLLLEGDAPAAPAAAGPGQRYALGATPLAETFASEEPGELPEVYGTKRLLLTARDPHWLYAHWDFTSDQLKESNSLSRDGHLVLRVFQNVIGNKPLVEQHVHPESRNWFVHVGRGGVRYVAQLGYHDRKGNWTALSDSAATLTPPDALSSDTSVRFETIPVEVSFAKLLETVKAVMTEDTTLLEAIEELRALGAIEFPRPTRASKWTPAQEEALAQLITMDSVRRVWMGSLEITELIRRKLQEEISSQAAAALSLPEERRGVSGVTSVSSPFGGVERRKGFWFNVNAELIIYGATEPDATVTIGGRKIQLRPDGSFSFRFALPDGRYELPIQATSADGGDSRDARLQFSRGTHYHGDVGTHPQDSKLKAPRAENVA